MLVRKRDVPCPREGSILEKETFSVIIFWQIMKYLLYKHNDNIKIIYRDIYAAHFQHLHVQTSCLALCDVVSSQWRLYAISPQTSWRNANSSLYKELIMKWYTYSDKGTTR